MTDPTSTRSTVASRDGRVASEVDLHRLVRFAEHSNSGALVTDAEGRTTWVNASFTRITGLELDDLRGLSPAHILAANSTDPSSGERLTAALAERRSMRFESAWKRRDGGSFWAEVDVQPLFDEDGSLAGFLGSLDDVTEQVNMRNSVALSEERLRLALIGAGIGTWDWNVVTGEVTFDERWCAMLGYELDEIEPHVSALERLVHPDDLPVVMRAVTEHFERRTDTYICDHRLRAKSGAWVWIHDAGRVLERADDGSPLRMCGVHIDITAAKAAEEREHFALELEAVVGRIQRLFIDSSNSPKLFEDVLDEVLTFSGATSGFIGESECGADGSLFLCTHAIRGFAAKVSSGASSADALPGLHECIQSILRDSKAQWATCCDTKALLLIAPLRACGRSVGAVGLADSKFDGDAAMAQRLEPLFDAVGGILNAWRETQARDAVENKLRESEARHRRIVDTALDAVVSMDSLGVITAWNAQAELIFGWSAKEVLGRSLANTIIPDGMREPHARGLRNFLAHGYGPLLNTRLESTALRRDGTTFPIEMSITPMRTAGTTTFTSFLRDITERKLAQAELRRHRDHLQELVTERTRDLNAAKERAERADQVKSVFLANMSHELRTPLHAVLGFARRGIQKSAALDDAKLHHYFDAIQTSSTRLLKLLNGLLDLSKLESGNVQLSPSDQDLRAIVDAACDEFVALAAERGVTICVEQSAEAHAWCDGSRLLQVVRNLLSNAIKFSPDGSQVRVELDDAWLPAEESVRTPCVRLRVFDQGCGIPDAELGSIFESFVQSSRTSSGAGGTGLGLAICRELVHAHGGTIHAENRASGGSVFIALLPRERISSAPAAPLPIQSSHSESARCPKPPAS